MAEYKGFKAAHKALVNSGKGKSLNLRRAVPQKKMTTKKSGGLKGMKH